jgi:hypothetical protein
MAEKELATATGPYTADTVPNAQKLKEKATLESAEGNEVSTRRA